MQYSIIVLSAILALSAAFAPHRFSARSNCPLADCTDKEKDKNGRCPGSAGYVSFAKEAPTDFAAVSLKSYSIINLKLIFCDKFNSTKRN